MRSYARAILRSNQMQAKPATSIRKSDGSGVLIGGGGGVAASTWAELPE